MYLRFLKICVLKYTNCVLQYFSSWIKVKLDLLTDIDMLFMVEKGIRRRMCHSNYRYAKANNKYTKDYDKNKESLYIQNWDVNN